MRRSMSFLVLCLSLVNMALAEESPTFSENELLERLRTYEEGQPRDVLLALDRWVEHSTQDPQEEARVAEALGNLLADQSASIAGRVYACQKLELIGTEAQVGLLREVVLNSPKIRSMALLALEAIPGEKAREAVEDLPSGYPANWTRDADIWEADYLRNELTAINALTRKRDPAAIPYLKKYMRFKPPDWRGGCLFPFGGMGLSKAHPPHPSVVSAAVTALGAIGTPEAAHILLRAWVARESKPALIDALLACAEARLACGDRRGARRIYQELEKRPLWPHQKLACFSGLVHTSRSPFKLVLKGLKSEDRVIRATAIQSSKLPLGERKTVRLCERLSGLPEEDQILLLEALAERGDRAAEPSVRACMSSQDSLVRVAAIRALVPLGNACSVLPLARVASQGSGEEKKTAQEALARIHGQGVDEEILRLSDQAEPDVRPEILKAVGSRSMTAGTEILLRAAEDPDPEVREASLESLARLADPGTYAKLIEILVKAQSPEDRSSAEKALLSVGGRIEDHSDRVSPLIQAMKGASPEAALSLLRLLGSAGGPLAIEVVRQSFRQGPPEVREEAVRVLSDWPDGSVSVDLLDIIQSSSDDKERILSLRGYLRLVREGQIAQGNPLSVLEDMRRMATTPETKRMLLASLADVADKTCLDVVASFLYDLEVQKEAVLASLRIAKALVSTDPIVSQVTAERILDSSPEDHVREQAQGILSDVQARTGASSTALAHDQARSLAQKSSRSAPQGYRVVCYLDCGPDAEDGRPEGPDLILAQGSPYAFPQEGEGTELRFLTIAFDGSEVVLDLKGLRPDRSYQLGLSWWDFDHTTRAQSVWGSSGDGTNALPLISKTSLPPRDQGPSEMPVPIPQDVSKRGPMRISIRNEGTPNVVVSEVWLLESEDR